MSTMTNDTLSECGERLRKDDPDRYFCTLFAPPEKREALFALYAFDHELDRIPAIVSEPALGEVRLAWWREAVATPENAAAASHPIVGALAALRSGRRPDLLETMIDARVRELCGEAPETLEGLVEHASRISGTLTRQAVAILAPDAERAGEVARDAGIAVGLVRMLCTVPGMAARGRLMFPRDLVAALHLESDGIMQSGHNRRMARAVRKIAERAFYHIKQARRQRRLVPGEALAAFLPLGFASRDLSILKHNDYNVFDERFQCRTSGRQVAVLARALLGRY